jgi:hypothetical protein
VEIDPFTALNASWPSREAARRIQRSEALDAAARGGRAKPSIVAPYRPFAPGTGITP